MRIPRWLAVSLAGLLVASACGAATPAGPAPAAVKLTNGKLVIGVINDQSGVYADLSGKNGVEAVNMAVADFKAKYGDNALGGPIEVISADHKNDPALASSKATEFYERSNADIILDVPTSSGALAIAKVAAAQKKLYINITAASTDLTGPQCNKYTFHYAYDTYMLARAPARPSSPAAGSSGTSSIRTTRSVRT
jgi:branched-chain amino acid transport system substrate-binding protein